MAILSVAITLSFHINSKPTDLERRISKPLGAIFWVFSVVMLGLGLANYISTLFFIFISFLGKKEGISWQIVEDGELSTVRRNSEQV